MISSLLIGRQNNDLGKIRVREFWIVRKEEARSTRPNVSRNNLGFGLLPQPVLYFFRTRGGGFYADRKSTRLNSSHSQISYAVFCLKKKKNTISHISRNYA